MLLGAVPAGARASLWDEGREAEERPRLEERLAAIVGAARRAWPEVTLSTEVFLAHVGARLVEGEPPWFLPALTPDGSTDPEEARLAVEARGADVFLACACARGEGTALRHLEARYFPDVEAALGRMRLPGGTEDVKQVLRLQLLVGDGATPGKIADYAGRGDLRAWLRVTAVRAALKVLRKEKGDARLEDEALLQAAEPPGQGLGDPELGYIKEVYRAAFRRAFQEALDALPDRDKNLLRQQVVDGLGIDDLCVLYQVHRATVARWIQKAREDLLSGTRKRFMTQVKVSRDECESILRLVQSQLDGTIRRRLQEV